MTTSEQIDFTSLASALDGELRIDALTKILYSTDASIYKEAPIAVVLPKHQRDIQLVIQFARQHKLSIIPRAGGTSLAGQCVGNGIVVDVSKYMNQIVAYDKAARQITVQPGIVRDDLNRLLAKDGLFFAPVTSTSNRANIGGMVGNNSCGQNSIVYGDTRQYAIRIKALLSDGSEATFESTPTEVFNQKLQLDNLEGQLYRQLQQSLAPLAVQENIRKHYPKPAVTRRNTGYALDALINRRPFAIDGPDFNFCQLITGSEGTLAFITEITLQLSPLPPPFQTIAVCQYDSIEATMKAVAPAMRHRPFACELMDKTILDCTKDNLKYKASRDFFKGDPKGVLLIEFRSEDQASAIALAKKLIDDLKVNSQLASHSILEGSDCKKVWELRKAGLGLLANLPGDPKAIACIEDTAVSISDLPAYIAAFENMMAKYDQEAIFYAHAGAGELHLRPILDLKKKEDRKKLYDISLSSAKLVKQFNGSLSGEHGDGRVRAPFIELVLGADNYALIKSIKNTWDPSNIFNPHKIVTPKAQDANLRYDEDQVTADIDTFLDFSATDGILRLAEKCNGSGDCRKSHDAGGTMCPSFHVTQDELHSTRGRANVLRSLLTENTAPNPFNHQEIKSAMDLCISCKGCSSECPSNVDMSTLKAEFLYQYQATNGIPWRSKFIAHIHTANQWGGKFPWLANRFLGNTIGAQLLKKITGVAAKRSLPKINRLSLAKWFAHKFKPSTVSKDTAIYIFCDEFTNYNDSSIGIKAIQLLSRLGYDIRMANHDESGRAALSKGLLKKAKRHAENNVNTFEKLLDDKNVLIGIEPSALLSFRDEYPKLVDQKKQAAAKRIAKHCFLVEEFLAKEIRRFKITSEDFDARPRDLLVHVHCHQKALSSTDDVFTALSLPAGHRVKILNTGCCGMAGSFGYEKEHYDISMQIGELSLFPAVREKKNDQIILAAGTSCRHQITDGTAQKSVHPVELLRAALKDNTAASVLT